VGPFSLELAVGGTESGLDVAQRAHVEVKITNQGPPLAIAELSLGSDALALHRASYQSAALSGPAEGTFVVPDLPTGQTTVLVEGHVRGAAAQAVHVSAQLRDAQGTLLAEGAHSSSHRGLGLPMGCGCGGSAGEASVVALLLAMLIRWRRVR
jgi:hypothetical protein